MKKINVIGNTLLDVNFELPKQYLHRFIQKAQIELPFGEKISAQSYRLAIGGSGANVAVGLAKQGFKIDFYTTLSEDGIGRFLLEELRDNNVRVESPISSSHSSLSVVLRVGSERTILSGRPGEDPLTKLSLPEAGWFYVGPVHGDNQNIYRQVIDKQIKTNQPVSLNPSIESIEDFNKDFLVLLRSTEILFINQKEASVLTKSRIASDPKEVMNKLLELGPAVICLTCAEMGAYVGDSNIIFHAQALIDRDNRIDATGAGDAFASGFLGGYLSSDSDKDNQALLKRALSFGIINAASVINKVGGQAGLLKRGLLEKEQRYVKIKRVV